MNYYRIADLTVQMDTFGRTKEQAALYACPACSSPDIRIQSEPERVKAAYPHLSDEECEYLASGSSFYRQLLDFDGMMLHSSAVIMDGKAYLFTADSGTGKSTHTRLWQQAFGGDRARILNDDKPAVRLVDGVWYAYGTPWSGKTAMNENVSAPVAGVAIIERAPENSIHPAGGLETVRVLLRQVNKPNDSRLRGRVLELLDDLMNRVPVWKLQCNMDPEAARVAYEAMSGAIGRE